MITGFTSGAAITIASSQFRPILGIPGSSSSFIDSILSVFRDLNQIGWWDALLGFGTVGVLVILKVHGPLSYIPWLPINILRPISSSFYQTLHVQNLPGSRSGSTTRKAMWIIGLARNAIVVIFGTGLAYAFHTWDFQPFQLTGILVRSIDSPLPFLSSSPIPLQYPNERLKVLPGSMGQGLPPLNWPPFSTEFGNQTLSLFDMTAGMGTTLVTMPIISTIEHIAIAKAFCE